MSDAPAPMLSRAHRARSARLASLASGGNALAALYRLAETRRTHWRAIVEGLPNG